MKRIFTLFLLIMALLSGALPALAQATAPEAPQVVFLIDHSGSMTERAFGGMPMSRWDVVKQSVPEWLNRLPADALVGMATVGGACGRPPVAWRRVSGSRDDVLNTLNQLSPNGQTPLNAVLERIPELFLTGAGPRKVVLLSDGGNSCAPQRNTCDLARELYAKHRITIEIVGFVVDPALASEFECIAQVTGGHFVAPADIESWLSFRVPAIDPWPMIVFALGSLGAVLAATVVYRHFHRALGLSPRRSALVAGVFLAAAGLVLAAHLMFNLDTMAALVGSALVLAVAAAFHLRRAPVRTLAVLMALPLALALLQPGPAMAQATAAAPQCLKRQGFPVHHVVVVDVSGSVYSGAPSNLAAIKERVVLYLCNHAQAGDAVSLVAFGRDDRSSAEEIASFELSGANPQAQINQALEEIRLPDPKETQTYFRMLRSFLDDYLRRVRHTPSVVVFSDGVSDNPTADEPTYGAFGRIYPLPNASRIKVAYRGPAEIDPADVFNTPLPAPRTANAPAIQACLIDPQLSMNGPSQLELAPPWWNPFSYERSGTVRVSISQECVERVRRIGLRLVHDQGQIDLGMLELNFGPTPRRIDVPVHLPVAGPAALREGSLVLALNPGTRFERKQLSTGRFPLKLKGWLDAYGLVAMIAVGAAILLLAAIVALAIAADRRRRRRPLVVKTVFGQALSLNRQVTATIGGSGATLALPDVPAGQVLARALWDGNKEGMLSLTAEPGVRMAIDGVDVVGMARYAPGSLLRFTTASSASPQEVTLLKGDAQDFEFGGASLGSGADRFGLSPSFTGADPAAGGLRI